MADLATKIPQMADADRPLLHAGVSVLALAFLVKAGMWPLSFWLPSVYLAAAAPVVAMFAIMTKVGAYAVLRLAMLLFGPNTGASAGVGASILMVGGMATMVFGLIGVLASQVLGKMTSYLILISSGTVLAVIGFALAGGGPNLLAGALYYLVSSTLATSALFLLIELMQREQGSTAVMLALTADAYGLADPEDEEKQGSGLAIPATLSVLGLSFVACVLLVSGLPPLSGFVGKFAMLSGALTPSSAGQGEVSPWNWWFMGVLILSGLAALIALVRVGIQTFWTPEAEGPKVLVLEILPVVALILFTVALTLKAETAIRYMNATANTLLQPKVYIEGVMGATRSGQQVDGATIP